jgi:hypothetical protein
VAKPWVRQARTTSITGTWTAPSCASSAEVRGHARPVRRPGRTVVVSLLRPRRPGALPAPHCDGPTGDSSLAVARVRFIH